MRLAPHSFPARRPSRTGARPGGTRPATLALVLWLMSGAILGLPAPAVGQEPAADPPSQDFAERVERILQDLQEQRSRRLDALEGQLDTLERLLDERERRSAAPATPPASVAVDSPDRQNPIRSAPGDTDGSAGVDTPVQDATSVPPAHEPLSVSPADVAPVDSLALADSLFGADEIELALKTYQGLGPNGFSDPDRRWIRYQIATCQRRLGQIGAAEQEYRELLGANREDFVADHARWWLGTIQTRKRMTGAVQGIETAIKTLQEQMP